MNIQEISKAFSNCECGNKHEFNIKDIVVESNATNRLGEILKKNKFPKNILVVADKTTLSVSQGIQKALKDFNATYYIYEELRVATMQEVNKIEDLIKGQDIGVLAVGTGSIHDTCRMATARQSKMLCLFATAPSMDGFASYNAPIVDNNFKITYEAKSPEVIIADTKILASSPSELKSAGFGDMVAKYVALIDWQVSHLITGESYCKRVAGLTRYATDKVFEMADKVTLNDEECAKKIFEGLILTGIAMSFTKTSRPASGTEHIMAHFIECKELLENKLPNYHGRDVGVCTLKVLKYYQKLSKFKKVTCEKEKINWNDVKEAYSKLYPEVEKLNTPDTITDSIDPRKIEENWEEIVSIIKSVPSYEEVKKKMKTAGCDLTFRDIKKPRKLVKTCLRYHPYMRRRLSLYRLSFMIKK